jgi:hypothetical protein
MTTVKVRGEINPDGKLRLEVPVDLPAGNAEVLVVIQPEVTNGHQKPSEQKMSARSGLFASDAGRSLGVDAALDEMNNAWKSNRGMQHSSYTRLFLQSFTGC